MPIFIPKWVLRRLKILWNEFNSKEFTFEDAQTTLNEDSRLVALVLSELNRSDFMTTRQDPSDLRKKLYQIKHPEDVKVLSRLEIKE